MPGLHFRGTAHPPAGAAANRARAPDLSAAEIHATNLGARGPGANRTTPVYVEHETSGAQVGHIISSYKHPVTGAMRVAGVVDDPAVAAQVRSGELRGLSLSTNLQWHPKADGKADTSRPPLSRVVDECSLCAVPGRPGCYVDTIDGQRVPSSRHEFSASSDGNASHGARSHPPTHPPSHLSSHTHAHKHTSTHAHALWFHFR